MAMIRLKLGQAQIQKEITIRVHGVPHRSLPHRESSPSTLEHSLPTKQGKVSGCFPTLPGPRPVLHQSELVNVHSTKCLRQSQ